MIGEDVAFGDLLERYRPEVKALIRRRVSDPRLVEEITQETFLRAFQFRGAYRQGTPLWPWLSKIAVRICANVLQQRRSLLALEVAHSPVARSLSERLSEQPDERTLSLLSERDRRVLLLHHVLGFSRQDIAAYESLSLAAARAALLRATKAFREAASKQARVLGVLILLVATRLRTGTARASASLAAWSLPAAELVAGAAVVMAMAVTAQGARHARAPSDVLSIASVKASLEAHAYPGRSGRPLLRSSDEPSRSVTPPDDRDIGAHPRQSVPGVGDTEADAGGPVHCDAGIVGGAMCQLADELDGLTAEATKW